MVLATGAVLLITLWVRRTHGPRAAVVMLGLSAVALSMVWVAYEILPLEHWSRGNLPVGLVIFALPALAGVVVAARTTALAPETTAVRT